MNLFAPATAAAASAEAPAPTGERIPVLPRLGGAALVVAPLLMLGGMLTSPLQTEPGTAGYIQSLAADPALSLASANFLHYAWVAMAAGALATIALLRGRRGRVWLSISAVLVFFGAIQMSGLLLSDWFLISAGNLLPIEEAVAMDTAAKETSALVWLLSAQLSAILGIASLSLALARAKVVSWWVAPLGIVPFVVMALNLGWVGAVVGTIAFAPLVIAGVKLLRGRR
ncbi:hypothetical protein [Desertivibrio insolitus]|uniref:hypothetical protein n=1 Tax=Herbiconiux sp. SYSU D00978 TaxID=2812562 RepID=UPI001A977847|nr:hypothetical protein [Herbiconiux sp. SYSU D00978]